MNIAPYAKALIGALVAGVGAGATAAIDDRITYGEWWMIAAAAATALAGVYAIPNRDPAADHQDESVQPPEYGEGE